MNYEDLINTLEKNIKDHFGESYPKAAVQKLVSGQKINLPKIEKIIELLSNCSRIKINYRNVTDYFSLIVALSSFTKIVHKQEVVQTPQEIMRKRISDIQKDASLSPSEKSKLVMEVISPSSSSMMQKKVFQKSTETSLIFKRFVGKEGSKSYEIPFAVSKEKEIPEFLTWMPQKTRLSASFIEKIDQGKFEDYSLDFQEKIDNFNENVEKMKDLLTDFAKFSKYFSFRFFIFDKDDKNSDGSIESSIVSDDSEEYDDISDEEFANGSNEDDDILHHDDDVAEYDVFYALSRENGCPHYLRNIEMKCPVCSKYYPCRLCHDAEEDHELPRKDVSELRCLNCDTEQAWGDVCSTCGTIFGAYNCHVCHYCDNFPGKQIFHCKDCGICRVGDGSKYKHCDKCNACWHIDGFDKHRCFMGGKKALCAACGEPTFDSRCQSISLPCGHILHYNCYMSLLDSGKYNCPMCRKLVLEGDSKERWEAAIDDWVKQNPVPAEFADQERDVSCNECGHNFHTKISITAYKCPSCHSYNTQEA